MTAGAESLLGQGHEGETQNLRVDYLALRAKDGLGNWIVLPDVWECEDDSPYTVDLHWIAAWDIVQ